MCFDEPEPFIYAARNFGEQIRRIRVFKFVGQINGIARLASESGQRTGDRLDMGRAVGDVQRILCQAGTLCRRADGAFGNAAQLHDPLGNQIHIRGHGFVDLIEQFVEADEVRSFDVPMRLFHLHLEIYGIGQTLIHQAVQLHPPTFRDVVFGFIHLGCFRSVGFCFHELVYL